MALNTSGPSSRTPHTYCRFCLLIPGTLWPCLAPGKSSLEQQQSGISVQVACLNASSLRRCRLQLALPEQSTPYWLFCMNIHDPPLSVLSRDCERFSGFQIRQLIQCPFPVFPYMEPWPMFNFVPWDWARIRTCLSMFAPSPRRGFPLWRTCSWLQLSHPPGQGFQVSGAQCGGTLLLPAKGLLPSKHSPKS